VTAKPPEAPPRKVQGELFRPHRVVNVDTVAHVQATARGVVIVGRRGGRDYMINVPLEEVEGLLAKLGNLAGKAPTA
jgi:hypothetical protein